ncbi:hypothetical protein ACP4OV_031299 [Aristida adscensionis]
MGKRAGEIEGQETPAPPASAPPDAKRSRRGTDDYAPSAGMCDDVLHNILARLPARDAVASMALSRRHGRLVRGREFRSLHRRLGAPLPRPHVAYVATAPVTRRPGAQAPVTRFLGFHVAVGDSAGAGGGPMRSLAGRRFLGKEYVNTCNGVLLFAGDRFAGSCTCILWNPAVADVVKEVTILPEQDRDPAPWTEYLVLGLGYGPRSETYKLVVCRKKRHEYFAYYGGKKVRLSCGGAPGNGPHRDTNHYEYSLLVYTLGGDGGGGGGGDGEMQPGARLKLKVGLKQDVSQKSLYVDGSVYLLPMGDSVVKFDVDDEIFTAVDFPGNDDGDDKREPRYYDSGLMELSGQPCVVLNEGDHRMALWMLSGDGRRWELRCAMEGKSISPLCSISGVWDCGGVLALYSPRREEDDDGELFLYNTATEELLRADLPGDVAPVDSGYEICWGYKPTLVSPASVVGELSGDEEPRRDGSAEIVAALRPVSDRDKRRGHDATLDTVCFWEFMARIMRKLPNDMQDVINMQLMDSEDPVFAWSDDDSDPAFFSGSDSD